MCEQLFILNSIVETQKNKDLSMLFKVVFVIFFVLYRVKIPHIIKSVLKWHMNVSYHIQKL